MLILKHAWHIEKYCFTYGCKAFAQARALQSLKYDCMTIIKYFEWLKILPTERKEVYELCTRDPQVESGYRTIKILDKRTALSMIRENALPLVHSDSDGMIWESAPLLPCPISHYNTNPFSGFLVHMFLLDSTGESSQ